MSGRTREVSLSLTGAPTTHGRIEVHDLLPPARVWRAVRSLLAMWLVAVGCIFIPALHFVLVPTFFVVGLVRGYVKLGESQTLLSASGLCPRCQVERQFSAGGGFREGRTIHCDGCGSQLHVHAVG